MTKTDIPLSDAVRQTLKRLNGKMLIAGEWIGAGSGDLQAIINPATGKPFMSVPAAGAEDVDRAVVGARKAFESPDWSKMRSAHRQRLLLKLADLMADNLDEFAQLESLDNGKPVSMSKAVDVRGAIEFLRYMAGWATKIEGRTLDVSFPAPRDGGEYFAYTRREAVGVVGAIVPWNYPLSMAVWKLGPALATGCTVVLKPASETPLTALRLGELIAEAGYPAGVVNVVTGGGSTAGAALCAHPGVDKIAFTGSTEIGRQVGRVAIDRMAHVSLELGGKSPVVLFSDANLKAAIPGAAGAIFSNAGQTCTAGSRLYVHRSIFDEVVAGVSARAGKLRIGPGLDPNTQLGPLISEKQRHTVDGYVQTSLVEGATVAVGGRLLEGAGYFYEPTVLVGMSQAARVVQEEIFGPVLVALPFDDDEEVVALANDSPFGLAASLWSDSLAKVHKIAPRIKAGTVWVNCHNMLDPNLPFGGYKWSGIGREMGRSVIEMYTQEKSVLMVA